MIHREAVLDLLAEILTDIELHDHRHNWNWRELAELVAFPEGGNWRDELEKALGLGGDSALVTSVFNYRGSVSGEPWIGRSLGTYWDDPGKRWMTPSDEDWDEEQYRRIANSGGFLVAENEFRSTFRASNYPQHLVTEAIIRYVRFSR